jgi:putative spermidine/putrescine transport system permease protein
MAATELTRRRTRRTRPPGNLVAEVLGGARVPVLLVACAVAVVFLLPLAMIVASSFSEAQFLSFPPEGFTFDWYGKVLDSPWLPAFATSLRVAALATLVATVVGTLAALGVRRLHGRVALFRTLLLAPVVLPYIVYAFGLYLVFDEVGVVGSSLWPVVAGQATLAFPLVFIAVSAGLSTIDPAVYRAGASLGARWPAIVALVELPLIRRHVAGGALFAFAWCFDEVVVAVFVGSPETPTLPATIFGAARETVSPELAAVSTVVTLLALTTIAGLSFALGRSARLRTSRRKTLESI